MTQGTDRIEFLKNRIEALKAQKENLQALASTPGFSEGTRNKWTKRLDQTLETLRKYSVELSKLLRQP
jgi:chaperonin cofactor prefoldin